MYNAVNGVYTLPDNDDDNLDDYTVIKDRVDHHKGYDTHTIQRLPVHDDPNAKYGNWFVGFGITIVIIFGIVMSILAFKLCHLNV